MHFSLYQIYVFLYYSEIIAIGYFRTAFTGVLLPGSKSQYLTSIATTPGIRQETAYDGSP